MTGCTGQRDLLSRGCVVDLERGELGPPGARCFRRRSQSSSGSTTSLKPSANHGVRSRQSDSSGERKTGTDDLPHASRSLNGASLSSAASPMTTASNRSAFMVEISSSATWTKVIDGSGGSSHVQPTRRTRSVVVKVVPLPAVSRSTRSEPRESGTGRHTPMFKEYEEKRASQPETTTNRRLEKLRSYRNSGKASSTVSRSPRSVSQTPRSIRAGWPARGALRRPDARRVEGPVRWVRP